MGSQAPPGRGQWPWPVWIPSAVAHGGGTAAHCQRPQQQPLAGLAACADPSTRAAIPDPRCFMESEGRGGPCHCCPGITPYGRARACSRLPAMPQSTCLLNHSPSSIKHDVVDWTPQQAAVVGDTKRLLRGIMRLNLTAPFARPVQGCGAIPYPPPSPSAALQSVFLHGATDAAARRCKLALLLYYALDVGLPAPAEAFW